MPAFRFDLLFAALPLALVEVLAAPLPFLFVLLSGPFRATDVLRLDLHLLFNCLLFNALLRLWLLGCFRLGLRGYVPADHQQTDRKTYG
jgi:hypothetical protein